MLTASDIIPAFLAASPELRTAQNDGHIPWEEEDEPGIHHDLAAFAQYIVRGAQQNRITQFSAIFEAVERLLVDGDSEVEDFIVVDFLETLQNTALNNEVELDRFVVWLGPATQEAWSDLAAEWDDLMETP